MGHPGPSPLRITTQLRGEARLLTVEGVLDLSTYRILRDSIVKAGLDDTSAVIMRLESGTVAVLTNSTAGLGAGTNLFEAHGSNGTIAVSRFPGHGGSFVVTANGVVATDCPSLQAQRSASPRLRLRARPCDDPRTGS